MKIKICGIKTLDEVKVMNEFLPDFTGFVFAKSKRRVDFRTAEILSKNLSLKIKKAGVFVENKEDEILGLYKMGIIDIAQLHGEYGEEFIKNLKKEGLEVIKVIKVFDKDKENNLLNVQTSADYLLFDTFYPDKDGGGNKTFNWDIKIKTDKPFFVAGGLSENNLADMAKKLSPYGADISSGAEENGLKTRKKVSAIMEVMKGINR